MAQESPLYRLIRSIATRTTGVDPHPTAPLRTNITVDVKGKAGNPMDVPPEVLERLYLGQYGRPPELTRGPFTYPAGHRPNVGSIVPSNQNTFNFGALKPAPIGAAGQQGVEGIDALIKMLVADYPHIARNAKTVRVGSAGRRPFGGQTVGQVANKAYPEVWHGTADSTGATTLVHELAHTLGWGEELAYALEGVPYNIKAARNPGTVPYTNVGTQFIPAAVSQKHPIITPGKPRKGKK